MISSDPIRVFLIDDHPIVRAGARLAIGGMEGYLVCGETGTASHAPEDAFIARADIVIVDLLLGTRGDGLELIAALRTRLPPAKLLVFSMNAEELFAERALRAGANGYLVKGGDLSELQDALRRIRAGETYVSAALAKRIAAAGDRTPGATGPLALLSDRELQVFLLLGAGKSTQQIADELGVSMKTASTHRENLKLKLGIASAPELVRRAVAHVVGQGRAL